MLFLKSYKASIVGIDVLALYSKEFFKQSNTFKYEV